MSWSVEETLRFIELYRMEESIWNPKSILHKDKNKVNDSWKRLADAMGIPMAELKKKKESLMIVRNTFPNEITDREEMNYSDIPHFPKPTVPGHPGWLVFGRLDGIEVVCFAGKVLFFEGYDSFQCTVAVRVMKLLGITHLILSNAAGSVDEDIRPGDVMIMKDHINLVGLVGLGPLIGPSPQVDRWGERHLCLSQVYDKGLRSLAEEAAVEVGLQKYLKEGVYMMTGGPNFETVAEARMIRMLGANVVGMSTVADAIVAVQAGMKVFSFSIISNMCLLDYNTNLNIDHVENMSIGRQKAPLIAKWIRRFLSKIVNQPA